MEEMFFFKYHLKCTRKEFMEYPINERKWIVARWLKQKDLESAAIDKAKKKKSH